MRVYILDDEKLAVQRLTRLLEATGRVTIAGASTDPEEALAFLRTHDVDALFLDIQMPELTGFELLERLERQPLVIFTTAFDRYALNAFDANSVDYLLKPIEPDRLDRALDKAERYLGTGLRESQGDLAPLRAPDIRALARELAAALQGRGTGLGRQESGTGVGASSGDRSPFATRRPVPETLVRIASRVGERTTVLDVARISHFISKDKLTFAVANGREHVIDHTLSELETRLDARRFARIHRATIVNIGFVQELFPAVDGGVLVRLKDDRKTELSVARDRVRELKERLGI